MTPTSNVTAIAEYAVGLRGAEGHPLSEAAADTAEQRAERFPFDAERDGAVVRAVLAAAALEAA